jgi:uncharacterized repeat protein (TIGR03803 family)
MVAMAWFRKLLAYHCPGYKFITRNPCWAGLEWLPLPCMGRLSPAARFGSSREVHVANRFCILTFSGILGLAALAQAQTFTTLYSFCSEASCADGSTPYAGLLEAANGSFFGTTYTGGSNNGGTVFRIDTKGGFKTIYSFCSQTGCADGSNPYAGLFQGPSRNFYGTTESGGAASAGAVFKLTPSGTLSVVHSFDGSDGFTPYSGLVRAPNGNFYGTTGGSGSGATISGTVFKITPAGKLTTLHQFCSKTNCTDGANPWGVLVEAKDGNFYGTTSAGGTHVCKTRGEEKIGCGTVFRITANGKLTTLYNFCSLGGDNCTDGVTPFAGLVEASDGSFYGTTSGGGANADGTVFRITAKGKLNTVHSFQGADGANPYAGLLRASDGHFYGTTTFGGANNAGAIFKLATTGKLTTLYNFCSQPSCTDGSFPHAALAQAADGRFYGTTSAGGDADGGTIFSLSAGIGTLVKTRPASKHAAAAPSPEK